MVFRLARSPRSPDEMQRQAQLVQVNVPPVDTMLTENGYLTKLR
jgi:hypothetical protein